MAQLSAIYAGRCGKAKSYVVSFSCLMEKERKKFQCIFEVLGLLVVVHAN